jgi:hypothetical protein
MRQVEREQAWKAEGMEGQPPHGPMAPIDAKARVRVRSREENFDYVAGLPKSSR